MRLIHTRHLSFYNTGHGAVPRYAILSHRWSSEEQEVSYQYFVRHEKLDTTGYAKIVRFCELAHKQGYEYGWVDTCCIDKTSSSELSEAINSMFKWYEDAALCFVYLNDVDHVRDIKRSEWPRRGWTLQELIAPPRVHFFNHEWQPLGKRHELARELSSATGIDAGVLTGDRAWSDFSIAQRMSWAAPRTTSRPEYQAYCLLGLFKVNMPLLYGEGTRAFRRLQEEILASDEDTSLFAWHCRPLAASSPEASPSMFALSPAAFADSGDILCGFNTLRILFESTSRGMLLLIHRSYAEKDIQRLIQSSRDINVGMTLPLGCYRDPHAKAGERPDAAKGVYLHLAKDGGKWRRIGVVSYFDHRSMVRYKGNNHGIYTDDFVRMYIHNDHADKGRSDRNAQTTLRVSDLNALPFVNIRDTNRDPEFHEVMPWFCCNCHDDTQTGSKWCAHCGYTQCKQCRPAQSSAGIHRIPLGQGK